MAAQSSVVFYRYDGSPFSDKIDNLLLLKGIPHHKVDVSMTLPRPELSDLLGVSYRRIPILAIGNDIYCDTSLIASALERRFPKNKGYGTLFPPRKGGGKVDTGMIKAFSMFYADRPVFALGAASLPYNKFPAKFIEDRSQMRGSKINVEALLAQQPTVHSLLSSHMDLLEEQLADGRDWLFDTELPSLADISLQFPFAWVRNFRGLKEALPEDKFPTSIAWINRVSTYLKDKKANNTAPFGKITGDAAAKLISQASPAEFAEGFDETEAKRLGVQRGSPVSVAPDDTGRSVLTHGTLIGLNREEVVIETHGSVGVVRCHFPRLNFTIKAKSLGTKL